MHQAAAGRSSGCCNPKPIPWIVKHHKITIPKGTVNTAGGSPFPFTINVNLSASTIRMSLLSCPSASSLRYCHTPFQKLAAWIANLKSHNTDDVISRVYYMHKSAVHVMLRAQLGTWTKMSSKIWTNPKLEPFRALSWTYFKNVSTQRRALLWLPRDCERSWPHTSICLSLRHAKRAKTKCKCCQTRAYVLRLEFTYQTEWSKSI